MIKAVVFTQIHSSPASCSRLVAYRRKHLRISKGDRPPWDSKAGCDVSCLHTSVESEQKPLRLLSVILI